MIFLDPKSDIAFKKLFSDIAHKNILISFLNSVLERIEGEKIVEVIINDPSNVAETPISKTSIVDVRCTDQKNNQYIIEMQVITQKDYAAHAQYYSTLALNSILASGEKYDKLVPVIFVGILDFNLFKSNNYLSHHFILDNETHTKELKNLEFHFIELKKFDKEITELDNILDKWIYFLKNAVSLQAIPENLKNSVLEEAFNILAQSNWSKKELEAYDKYLDAIRSAASQLDTAFEKGIAKGEKKKSIEIAKQLLDILDIETIAKKTGLSFAEVKDLKREYK